MFDMVRPLRIKVNGILHSSDKGMSRDDALAWLNGYRAMKDLGIATKAKELLPDVSDADVTATTEMLDRFSLLTEETVEAVFRWHGEAGLYRLFFLMNGHEAGELKYFLKTVTGDAQMRSVTRFLGSGPHDADLQLDNVTLRHDPVLEQFNHNFVQPSWSRKLYNAGRHPGYLVHGVGGPRILVSHPFQGINGEIYSVYENAIDVVTSLHCRGFYGTMLFLDYLGGLNQEHHGIPGWALWFSIIAGHSDLVIFVKEYQGDFGEAQKLELMLTPDWVQKKLVEIPHSELRWAKKPEIGTVGMFITGRPGQSGREAFETIEREHALPFIENYGPRWTDPGWLFAMDEQGRRSKYPLDDHFWVHSDQLPPPQPAR